ncbi:DegT/DnrJ/EryC1/StrS aminotransferase family protein [Vibrio celticus]|uniref:dTDP-4-amino-4,6-dideoxy-D-glucose transaminase n=1 Tax=Vibrio celticus TaxID=446372 RepID=A0A1C3JC03_9VIBR|nr:DegT/DnrJ/EryC1/StrS family aminotransferase [Vibrio celticus]SBT12663.1 dTDP-4-amino-4,6-dideoxy-D-glucose transaminase [Vibrio celticus]
MTIKLNNPLKPDIDKLTSYLEQVHDNGWYTNFGPLHQQLTDRLEEFLDVENLLLVSNGTVALQVACKVLGVERAISTPFSFVATTSALMWQGIDVAYCDIEANSYNLSPVAIKSALAAKESRFDGIVATHVYGNPCDVKEIGRVADVHNVKVIYDAAHAFGVKVDKQSVLKFGDASTLSFHATKIFHTVEGGAIVFKNRDDFLRAKSLINFGIQDNGSLGEPGINAKLNEYQCAVGLTLLDQIEDIITHRSHLLELYRQGLTGVVEMPTWHQGASYNGAYMPIFIECEDKQAALLAVLSKNNIQYRRYFSPSLNIAYPNNYDFGCPISKKIAQGIICLPLHYSITPENIVFVCETICEALND